MSMTPAPRAWGLFVRGCQSAWLITWRHACVQRFGHAAVHTAQAAGMVGSDGLLWYISVQRHNADMLAVVVIVAKFNMSQHSPQRSTANWSFQCVCDHRAGVCRHCYGAHSHRDTSLEAGARHGQQRQGGVRSGRRQCSTTWQQQGQPHQPWWDTHCLFDAIRAIVELSHNTRPVLCNLNRFIHTDIHMSWYC